MRVAPAAPWDVLWVQAGFPGNQAEVLALAVQVLKSLMRADSNDYGDGITLGRRKSSKAIRAAEAEVEEEGDGDADRGDGPTPACTNFCGGGRSVPAQASGGPFTAGELPGPKCWPDGAAPACPCTPAACPMSPGAVHWK